MRSEQLQAALGEVRDDYIRDAHACRKIHSVKKAFLRCTAAAAAVCLLFAGTVTVLAASDVDAAYEMIYAVAPSLAQQLKPVCRSSLSNGIEMNVISADIRNDTAEVLISMRDLEQDRIDDTIDLLDSYSIHTAHDTAGHCRLKAYDPETKTAYFLVSIQQLNKEKFENEIITFRVREFLSNKKTFSGVIPGLMIEDITRDPLIMQQADIRGEGGTQKPDELAIMEPAETPLCTPMEGVEITGLGYLNGELHVQVYYHDIAANNSHGFLSLAAPNGQKIEYDYAVSFWDEDRAGSFDEVIFEIPWERLKDCRIYGEFISGGCHTKGDWEITFPLSAVLSQTEP